MKSHQLLITSIFAMLAMLAPITVRGTNLSAPVGPDAVCSGTFADGMDPWSALNADSIGEMADVEVAVESRSTLSGTENVAPWSLLNAHSIDETSNDDSFANTPGPDAVTANYAPWSTLNAHSIGEAAENDNAAGVSGNSDSLLSGNQCTNTALNNAPVTLGMSLKVQRLTDLTFDAGYVHA